jgi:hypothetical protein
MDQLAARHEVVLNPVLRTRSPHTVAHLATAAMAVTIMPASALTVRPAGVVRRLRFDGQARRDYLLLPVRLRGAALTGRPTSTRIT